MMSNKDIFNHIPADIEVAPQRAYQALAAKYIEDGRPLIDPDKFERFEKATMGFLCEHPHSEEERAHFAYCQEGVLAAMQALSEGKTPEEAEQAMYDTMEAAGWGKMERREAAAIGVNVWGYYRDPNAGLAFAKHVAPETFEHPGIGPR
jgi:hypothetical protein